MYKLAAALKRLRLPEKENLITSIAAGHTHPDAVLAYAGEGAAKRCYYLTPNVILKLVKTRPNQTTLLPPEVLLIDGVLELFLGSFHLSLPQPLTLGDISYSSIELQPAATPESSLLPYSPLLTERVYSTTSVFAASSIPFSDYTSIGVASHRWLEEFFLYYGEDRFKSFAEFCRLTGLTDLTNGNIGYLAPHSRPVILDWDVIL